MVALEVLELEDPALAGDGDHTPLHVFGGGAAGANRAVEQQGTGVVDGLKPAAIDGVLQAPATLDPRDGVEAEALPGTVGVAHRCAKGTNQVVATFCGDATAGVFVGGEVFEAPDAHVGAGVGACGVLAVGAWI